MIIYEENGVTCSCSKMSSVPEGITGYEVTPPEDKVYREAWEIVNGELVINATKKIDVDRNIAKGVRDEALEALVHDFGDGRIIQVRPKDEGNIRNAIEIMAANALPSINWLMLDDAKYPITVAELQTALAIGQTKGLAVWDSMDV